MDAELAKSLDKDFRNTLQDRLNLVKQKPLPYKYQSLEKEWRELRRSNPADFDRSPETGIKKSVIDRVARSLTELPKGFKPIKQIEKIIKQRKEMFFTTKILNWAGAELLAYGSILLDGHIVRISGQDVQRGTFSHRHAVLRDAETNQAYNLLDKVDESDAVTGCSPWCSNQALQKTIHSRVSSSASP